MTDATYQRRPVQQIFAFKSITSSSCLKFSGKDSGSLPGLDKPPRIRCLNLCEEVAKVLCLSRTAPLRALSALSRDHFIGFIRTLFNSLRNSSSSRVFRSCIDSTYVKPSPHIRSYSSVRANQTPPLRIDSGFRYAGRATHPPAQFGTRGIPVS